MVNNDEEVNMMLWDVIHRATQDDGNAENNGLIRRGMPDSGLELDKSLREYHRFRHDLHEVDGVLCYRNRIMVPTALRTKVLMGIHAAHQGVLGMRGRID